MMNLSRKILCLGMIGLISSGPAFSRSFQQLKDINQIPFESSSIPQHIKSSAGRSFFAATTPEHGNELWVTDGTEAGTRLVKDINPGPASSGIGPVSAFLNGGTLLFFADDGVHGRELWISNGTADGTFMVKDVWEGSTGSSAGSIVVMNGVGYFSANDGIRGSELWRTDGTPGGTMMVRDIDPGGVGSGPGGLVVLNSTIYFHAYTSTAGTELWRSDGTEAGTVMVRDVFPGLGSSQVEHLTVMGNNVYFVALDGTTPGRNLWRTNGTSAGTVMVKDIDPNPGGLSPMLNLTTVGTQLYFFAQTVANGWELWKSDGSAAGTVMIELRAGSASGAFAASSSSISTMGTDAYFLGSNGAGQSGIWRTNGTTTTFLSGVSSSSNPAPGVIVGGNLYLQVGTQLWRTSGTPAGTAAVYDGTLTMGGPPSLLGTSLLFAASRPSGSSGAVGTELYQSNGQSEDFQLVRNIATGTSSSSPGGFVRAGGRVFFTANDGIHGTELWSTDGTAAGTSLAKDIRPGTQGVGQLRMLPVGNRVYFPASDGANGVELWTSDGTDAGTFLVADLQPGSGSSMDTGYAPLGALGDMVFFRANDGIHGEELWATDGTEAGTRLVKDINPGTDGSHVGNQAGVRMNDALYFTAYAADSGWELWRTDGTSTGTFLVADVSPGPGSGLSGTYALHPPGVLANGLIFFAASAGGSGRELWVSDGTVSGTRLVRDIQPGSSSALSPLLRAVPFNEGICFPADDGAGGIELWFSDGTSEGTKLVGDINPGSSSSDPEPGVVCGGALYFTSTDAVSGAELWRWNGGNSVASRVIDLAPGSASPGVLYLTCGGGRLYFAADTTGANLRELWSSDGTNEGTFMITNDLPGHPSIPQEMTVMGGQLIFSARYPSMDRELASYTLPVAAIRVEHPVGTPVASGTTTIDFGSITRGASSLPRTIRVANTGTEALSGLGVEIDGTHAGDFTVLEPGLPTNLAPGADATLQVTFRPGAEGARTATLAITSNDPDDSPFPIALEGVGAPPPVFIWSGLGTDDRWSTPGNWVGGVAPPQDGSAWVVFPDTPRNSPVVDMPWHVHGIRIEGADYGIKTFSGVSLRIGGGGVVEASANVSMTFFNLPVVMSSDQAWRLEGGNPVLPRVGAGWALDTNGSALTIEVGSFGSSSFAGGISGSGSLVLAAGGTLSLEGPLSLSGGIRVHENALLTVHDISYPGVIHGVNASILGFQGTASGPFLPVITGQFSQIQYIGGPSARTLELLSPSSASTPSSSGVHGIRLRLGDDAAFGLSHSFSLGGVIGEAATLEAIGGARVLPQRLYRQYASSLVIAGEHPITFEGGANLGGYTGETPYIDIREPSGLLRIHGAGFGNHSHPMEKRGAGTLELGGNGNNDFRFPLHVSGGRLALNKVTQSGGIHAFAGDLRIGDGIGTDELVLLNSNQIADTSVLRLESNGVFDLGGKQETLSKLEGSGTVGNSSTMADSTLTVAVPAGQSSTFSGTLADSIGSGSRTLGLRMAGLGTMILTGSSSNSLFQVESGVLQVDGSLGSSSSSVFVTGQGTLSGSGGLAGAVTVAGSGGGATLAPGPGIATLGIGGGIEVQPGNQRFVFEVDGTHGSADRLRVDDFIQLGAGQADLVMTDIQPAGVPSGPVVLIENTSLQATEGFFSGLPEGAQVPVGPHSYTITYEGGSGGNDVILLPPAPPQPGIQLELPDGGILAGFAMLDFGEQLGNPEFTIPEFHHDRTILIRNTGSAPLIINWVDVRADPMSGKFHFQAWNPPYAESIPAGGTREVILKFQPVQGTFSHVTGDLRIHSNDPVTPIRYVMLSGSVIQALSFQEAVQTAGLVGGDALPSATPFDDGVENLLKYAFNMNLAGPDSSRMTPGIGTSGLPSVMLAESPGGPVLRVEFVRRRGSGLVYKPKFSTGLSDFQPMTATEVVTPIDAKWERVTVEQPQNLMVPGRGFAVVEVISP